MEKYWGLPTWIMFRVYRRLLPKGHAWRHRRFTLEDWVAGETDLCRGFDLVFWCQIMISPLFVYWLIRLTW